MQILTDPGVDWSVAVAAAAAGMIASVAAIFSLAQLRYSERRHSEAVAALADDAGVGGDPRRDALELEQGKHRRWLIGGPVAAY